MPALNRFTNRLYYLTETLFMRSAAYQLLAVALVIATLSTVGGVLVHVIHPQAYRDTAEAIWWAFLRLTDPGYLGDDRGVVPRLISTILTVAGYVVFLGALVAIMTTWLDRLMAFLASGRSPIFERDHILILGWNDRIHALVEELVHTSRRLLPSAKKPAIVILCDPFEPAMHHELMQKLDPKVRKQCRLLVRSGNPLEAESLDRVDFAHARSVILISNNLGEFAERHLGDITAAKVLMSLKAKLPTTETPPGVVVEVSNPANKLLLASVGWKEHTEAVVAEEIFGRLFCQAVRFPGLSSVYRRLLTDSYSDSIRLLGAAEIGVIGRSLRTVVGSLPQGIPIGSLPKRTGSDLNRISMLDLDHCLTEDDWVVVVASNREESTDSRDSETVSPMTVQWVENPTRTDVRKILCLGWSSFLHSFLAETAHYTSENYQVTLLWDIDEPRERERLIRFAQDHPNIELTFLLGSLPDEADVRRLGPEKFDTIVLLADQRHDPLLSDAETVFHYVLLDRYFLKLGQTVWFLAELNDEDNRPLISGQNAGVIMTGEIVSHLLAQVTIQRSLARIYEDLFSQGGSELCLRGLETFIGHTGEVSFQACQQACLERKAVAVGIRRDDSVVLHPGQDERLRGSDKLVVVEWE